MRLISHRGVPATHLENTLASFHEAHQLGMKEIELDVRLAACQTPVILHDHTLRRTHKVSDVVAKTNASRLSELGVPTLAQVMEVLNATGMHATVEIKECSERAMAQVVEMCVPGGHTISSFNSKWIDLAHRLSDDISLQWTVEALDGLRPLIVPAVVAKGRVREVAADITRLTPVGVTRARALGLTVLSYTVKTRAHLKHALDLGIDGIFIDDPMSVRAWLTELQT